MTRQRFFGTLTLAGGVVALAGLPVWAQDGSRPSNGNTTGSAVSRDSGGGSSGGSSSSSGGSSGSSSVGVGSSGGSGNSSSTPSSWSSFEAPARAERSGDQSGSRSRTGSSSGQAVSRGDGGSRGSSSPRSAGSTASASGGDSSAPSRRAVPEYSRPRDGRPVSGNAAPRGSVAPPPINGNYPIYPVYPYYPWGFWGGYGFGLGYMYYDPFWYGGYGYGSPYGGYGYGGGYGGGSGGYGVSQSYRDTGGVRLKVDPSKAQVFVDGYYVGVIDSFDGVFQKLELEGGSHKIELKADGFEPITFDVLVTPGETVTFKGDMKPIR